LVETAIYSQWQHSGRTTLYYARWASGEVDIVSLNGSQSPSWAVEVKWTDRPYHVVGELKSCVEFLNKNPKLTSRDMLITSRTITGHVSAGGHSFRFVPAAEYAYTLGMNLLKRNPWGVDKWTSASEEEE
jgi:hypothetical protein